MLMENERLYEEYLEDNALSFDNFKVVSKFQAMERDLALVVDRKVTHGEIERAIKKLSDKDKNDIIVLRM